MTKNATDPVHPGEILREDFMKPAGISSNALAVALRIPATRVGAIVGERRAITADTAMRLGRYFCTTPQFWMNLQSRYLLDSATDAAGGAIERDVRPRNAA